MIKQTVGWIAAIAVVGILLSGCDTEETESSNDRSNTGTALNPYTLTEGVTYEEHRVGACTSDRDIAEMKAYSFYRFTTDSAGTYEIAVTDLSWEAKISLFVLEETDGEMQMIAATDAQSTDGASLSHALDANTRYDFRLYNRDCSTSQGASYDITLSAP